MTIRAKTEEPQNDAQDATSENGTQQHMISSQPIIAPDQGVQTLQSPAETECLPPMEPQQLQNEVFQQPPQQDTSQSKPIVSTNGSPQHIPQQPPVTQELLPTEPSPALDPNAPLSLADIQNPLTFKLDTTPPTKRKATKQDFFKQESGIGTVMTDSDPFSQLDPLWSVKKP